MLPKMLCRSSTAKKVKQGKAGQASKHFKIALHDSNKKNSTTPNLPDWVTAAHDSKALLPRKTDLQNTFNNYVCLQKSKSDGVAVNHTLSIH